MFLAGFVSGVTFMGTVAFAFMAGKRAPREIEVDEDFDWNHPEVAALIAGKAPIRRFSPGDDTVH